MYMLMVVRDPILGRPVEIQTWIVAIGVSAASLIAGSLVYMPVRRRIAYLARAGKLQSVLNGL